MVRGLDVAVRVRGGAIKLMVWFAFAQIRIEKTTLYFVHVGCGGRVWLLGSEPWLSRGVLATISLFSWSILLPPFLFYLSQRLILRDQVLPQRHKPTALHTLHFACYLYGVV